MRKAIKMKDIDFNKVKYPEFIKHHSFEPNLRINGDLWTIERKVSALAIEEENKIIVERIVEIAKENGITDLYLLDKKNIVAALQKQIPKKPRLNDSDYAYFECDSCGTAIAYAFEPEEHKYCLHCGQALDWGQEE